METQASCQAAKHAERANHNRGSTFTEVVFAAAIVAIVAVSMLSFSTRIRSELMNLTSKSECHTAANHILTSIKSLDNGTIVRTFLPTRDRPTVNEAVPGTNSDPYCRTTGRTAVCDTYNLMNMNAGGVILNGAPNYNSQNIRGAATWAQSMFNRFVPGICTGTGSEFTRTDLERILPTNLPLPAWLQNAYLFIREEGIGAAACDVASVSRIGANSSNDYEVGVRVTGDSKDCETKGRVSFPTDRWPTTLTLNMTNGSGASIPNGSGVPACTCRRSFQDLTNNGGPCNGMDTVNLALQSSEPGTLLLCRKNGPAGEIDLLNEWRSCGDLIYTGAASSFAPDLRNNVVYNQGLQTTWSLGNLVASTAADPHDIGIRDVDVGGNITPVNPRFRVDQATCPDRDLYCPQATPGGTGIFQLPRDSCDIDWCFPGTRHVCSQATAQTVCVGSTFPDDCGNDGCPGEMDCSPPPGPCIADNTECAENSSECGGSGYDNCGSCCSANGWYQYDTGYLPYNTNCPGACNMSGPKNRRYFCTPTGGAPGPSGGTPEVCAPIGPPPPPPPPPPPVPTNPWSWSAGMYQCTDHNGTKTCNFNNIGAGVVPTSGYSRYEADISVGVIAHDGDADEMSVSVSVTICSGGNCDTFSASEGPLYSPRGVEVARFSGTIGVAAGAGATVRINTRVDEATTKTYVTIRAIP